MKSFITIWDWNRWNSFTFYMQCHWMDNKQMLVNDNRAQFWKTFKSCIKLSTRITTAKLSILCKKKATNGWSKGKSRSQMQKSNNDIVISTRIHNKSSLPNNNRMTNYYLFGLWLQLVFFHFFFFRCAHFFRVCARRFRVIINREVSHIESNLHLLSVKQAAVAIKICLCAIVTAAAPWLQRHKSSM